MDFLNAFRSMPPSQRKALTKVLQQWKKNDPAGDILVGNLVKERYLDMTSWKRLFNSILKAYSGTPISSQAQWENFKNDLRKKFYRALVLKGESIRSAPPVLVGTVMPLKRFKHDLFVKHPARFRDEDAVDLFIQEFRRSGYLPPDTRSLLLKEAEYLLWITWQEKDSQSDPFWFAQFNSKEEIRTGLGLGHDKYKSEALIGFVFRLDAAGHLPTAPYRATFCDADFCIFFRPGDCEHHGYTNPLNGGKTEVDGAPVSIKPQPEAVMASKFYPLERLETIKLYP